MTKPACSTAGMNRPTTVPKIENGHLVMPDTPGWGLDPNEEALKAHPPKAGASLLDYGKKP